LHVDRVEAKRNVHIVRKLGSLTADEGLLWNVAWLSEREVSLAICNVGFHLDLELSSFNCHFFGLNNWLPKAVSSNFKINCHEFIPRLLVLSILSDSQIVVLV